MESEGVSLPLIHEHPMMPFNDLRKGDCCGRFESMSDGYYCKICDLFVHKKCGHEFSEFFVHPSHPNHTLRLQQGVYLCDFCGTRSNMVCYTCEMCNFYVDLHCAKYPPAEVIDDIETHSHKLTISKTCYKFDCSAKCGKFGNGFPYECGECDVVFHVDCIWHSAADRHHSPEVNHSYHSLHSLKLLKGEPPEYSDGKCRLCGRYIDELFYHCSSCNFTLDFRCVLNSPPQSIVDLKVHDHQLIL